MIGRPFHAEGSHRGKWRSADARHRAASPCDDCSLQAEADHRIANHLALLLGYVRLKTVDVDSQVQAPSRASVHVLLDGIQAAIQTIAGDKLHVATCFRDTTTFEHYDLVGIAYC